MTERETVIDADGVGAIAAATALIGTGYSIWQQVPVNLHFPASVLSLASYVFGFALMAVAGVRRAPRSQLALAGLLFAFGAYAASVVLYGVKFYGTDSLLFNAYSADLLRHGIDPYTQSMQEAFRAFGVPQSLVTPTTTGQAVFKLSYPALSFLIYIPALALHIDNLLWVSVIAHFLLIGSLWFLAPRALRTILPLIVFVDASYAQYTVGAVTDVLWVLPAVFAAAYWWKRPIAAAALLGVACAIKQTPWLLVPFALIDWTRAAMRERSMRPIAVPLATLALVFLIPNAPFLIWHPAAWWSGVTEPLSGGLIMFGSGLVQLDTANVVALDPHLLTAVSAALIAACLVLYAVFPLPMRYIPFVTPCVAYFFAPRSLQNYFMFWPAMLAAAGTGPYPIAPPLGEPASRRNGTWQRLAIPVFAGAALLTAVLIGVRIVVNQGASPQLTLETVRYDSDTGAVQQFRVRASSGPNSPRYMRFAVYQEGAGVGFAFLSNDIIELTRSAKTISLTVPPRIAEQITPDASVQIAAVDAMTGEQFYAPARMLDLATLLVRNGRLRAWTPPPDSMPVAWNYDPVAVRKKYVQRDGPASLRFRVSAPKDAEWRIVQIGQLVNASPGWLQFRLRPTRDYIGDAYPRSIFGIEVVDAYQNHTYYTIDSTLTKPKVYKRDRFTVNVFPGKLNAWNDVEVQLRSANGDAPFMPANATVDVNVVAAVRPGIPGTLSGDFGGAVEENR